jgi:hypothetical protein
MWGIKKVIKVVILDFAGALMIFNSQNGDEEKCYVYSEIF